jgi:hypothetical protein
MSEILFLVKQNERLTNDYNDLLESLQLIQKEVNDIMDDCFECETDDECCEVLAVSRTEYDSLLIQGKGLGNMSEELYDVDGRLTAILKSEPALLQQTKQIAKLRIIIEKKWRHNVENKKLI